jgi:hypothetical protein
MKPIAYMTAASVASWIAAAAILSRRTSFAILCGMLGPLAATSGTWLLVAQVYRHRPEQLTRLLVAAFVLKMAFFGAYVAVMLRLVRLRPIPFVVSFTGYFIGLYGMEALFLKRLFSERSG